MKIQYTLFYIKIKNVLVKSGDYYARSTDFDDDDIEVIKTLENFDTEELAVEHLQKFQQEIIDNDSYAKRLKGTYFIQKTYQLT